MLPRLCSASLGSPAFIGGTSTFFEGKNAGSTACDASVAGRVPQDGRFWRGPSGSGAKSAVVVGDTSSPRQAGSLWVPQLSGRWTGDGASSDVVLEVFLASSRGTNKPAKTLPRKSPTAGGGHANDSAGGAPLDSASGTILRGTRTWRGGPRAVKLAVVRMRFGGGLSALGCLPPAGMAGCCTVLSPKFRCCNFGYAPTPFDQRSPKVAGDHNTFSLDQWGHLSFDQYWN